MPTVNAIAQQKSLTADVSSKIFRTDFEASKNSTLIKGPMNTANDMIGSTFGLRSNISEMLGTYTEEKASFDSQFDKTMTSLKESADKLKEAIRSNEDERVAAREKAQETERERRESAEKFADDAREEVQEARQERQERAKELAEITHERMQNRDQVQREDTTVSAEDLRDRIQQEEQTLRGRTEQLANATRERAQTQRERTERFAEEYLVAEQDERAEDNAQNLDTTRDENTNAALSNVRNFVDRFNDAVTYFNENRDVSDRMNALAGSFDRTENFAGSLNAVGISVNENGRLAVNETRLADALNENSSNVNELLGRNGLAGRLNRNVELATSQRENLFPTVTDYLNNRRDEPTESLYAVQLNQTAALARENSSNFVNMFT